LSAIAGFNGYTAGSLEVFGEPYTDENILYNRKRIGFVSSSLFDKYLTWESAFNIVLAGLNGTLGLTFDIAHEDIKRAKKIMQSLGLREKINQPFCLLSKGERQKVLIARALVSNPEILILDEPGTGLDIYAREYVLNTVEALATHTDMTLIYVTHYAEEILPSFDKTMLMCDGRVYKQGKTEEIFSSDIISDFLKLSASVEKSETSVAIQLNMENGIDLSLLKD
jgi:iron complex transport system ATP-binding protein